MNHELQNRAEIDMALGNIDFVKITKLFNTDAQGALKLLKE